MSNDKNTGQLDPDLLPQAVEVPPKHGTGPFDDIVPWVIEFRVVGTHQIIKAPVSEKILVGRTDTTRGIHPEIDLDPYRGQERGVSRRHAAIYARDNRITVEDLGSSNGTFLNGEQLSANKTYRLRHGDRLRFGHLELQTHFIVKPSENEQTSLGLGNMIKVEVIGKGQRVLLADEDEYVCFVLMRVMEQAGFKVRVTRHPADAIAAMDAELPDIFITELVFSDTISGADLIRYLRSKQGDHQIGIITITSATAGYKMAEAIDQGADIFLGKPVAIDELISGLMNIQSSFGAQE
jgi:pSer/pThr/pTyr-binding forkhead associated (FHA) protein